MARAIVLDTLDDLKSFAAIVRRIFGWQDTIYIKYGCQNLSSVFGFDVRSGRMKVNIGTNGKSGYIAFADPAEVPEALMLSCKVSPQDSGYLTLRRRYSMVQYLASQGYTEIIYVTSDAGELETGVRIELPNLKFRIES